MGKLDIGRSRRAPCPRTCRASPFRWRLPTPFDKWDDIVARTQPLAETPHARPRTWRILIYTSGSTGEPKGVMLTFEAVTRATQGIVALSRQSLGQGMQGRVLSYLPLAHSFERAWIECSSFVDGNTHVYFAESMDTFLADLQRARPTTFPSPCRACGSSSSRACSRRCRPPSWTGCCASPFVGRLVGRKILKGLGLDQVKRAGSGSAPIPAELIEWYRRLGLNLIEGYGMTEDFAYSHSSREESIRPGYVGLPLPGVEVRLGDDGEILIKSPGQFSGYHNRPELNAVCFTDDGFFRTATAASAMPRGCSR